MQRNLKNGVTMNDWKQTHIFTLAYDALEYPKSFDVQSV